MKITKILIELEIQQKILYKHGIKREELENALLEGKPKFIKIGDNLYMAIAHYNQYITTIFEYEHQTAIIKTAYKSSDWQINRHKRK